MKIRKKNELNLHNFLRCQHSGLSEIELTYYKKNKKFYSITRKSQNYVENWLKDKCRGKSILDYCCGNGTMSIQIAQMAASKVIGIDISDVSIENAKLCLANNSLDKIVGFYVMDAEQMAFPDNSFDIVYESGVMHHLDLDRAYSEVARVLKPEGEALCIEALRHNPLIHYYRRRTPHLRTEWEITHILGKEDIRMAKRYFNTVQILQFFHLTAIGAVPFRKLRGFNIILNVLEVLDWILLRLPIVKWYAWQVVFVLCGPKK